MNSEQISRRQLLQSFSTLSAVGLAAVSTSMPCFGAATPADGKKTILRSGDVILFQGDSITDAKRDRKAKQVNAYTALGNGYAWLAAAQLLTDRPRDNFQIYNRGVSGDTVQRVADRWTADCLDLKPDVVSILIGVNDLNRSLRGTYKGDINRYSKDYRKLLKQTRQTLPEARLVIGEPFLLFNGEKAESRRPECAKFRAVARLLAQEFDAVFVPYQEKFDAVIKLAPPEHWSADGIHPSPSGAALMAHWWTEAVGA